MTVSADMLSLNQATVQTTPTREVFAACARAGVRQVGLWRDQYVDGDARVTRKVADDACVTVSSVCRGGFFTGTRSERETELDNVRAVEEAAILGAPVLVLVCGPVVDGNMPAAHAAIRRGIERLLPHAAESGVTLAVEPFHPMLITERSAIVTLAQANDLVAEFAHPRLGLVIDTYHVWWDPDLDRQLDRATGSVVNVQIGDWVSPTTLLRSRVLPGDGGIRLRDLLARIHARGYRGPIEVEVLNEAVWARPVDDVVRDVCRRVAQLLPATANPL